MGLKDEETTNSQYEWRKRRKVVLSCSVCPPNRVENIKRKNQHIKKYKCWKLFKKKQYIKKDLYEFVQGK